MMKAPIRHRPHALALYRDTDRLFTTAIRACRWVEGTAAVSRFRSVGANFAFDTDCVYTHANISVRDGVDLSYRQILMATRSQIHIGNNVMLVPQATAPIAIEHDAYIGVKADILPGVTVGQRLVIAAGAVVAQDVPPGSVVGGGPARNVCTTVEYPEKIRTKWLGIGHPSAAEKERGCERSSRGKHDNLGAAPALPALPVLQWTE